MSLVLRQGLGANRALAADPGRKELQRVPALPPAVAPRFGGPGKRKCTCLRPRVAVLARRGGTTGPPSVFLCAFLPPHLEAASLLVTRRSPLLASEEMVKDLLLVVPVLPASGCRAHPAVAVDPLRPRLGQCWAGSEVRPKLLEPGRPAGAPAAPTHPPAAAQRLQALRPTEAPWAPPAVPDVDASLKPRGSLSQRVVVFPPFSMGRFVPRRRPASSTVRPGSALPRKRTVRRYLSTPR